VPKRTKGEYNKGRMNPNGKVLLVVYAVVLLGCAYYVGYDTSGVAFGIGESNESIGLVWGTFLIATLVGGAGLVIAALLSWTRWRAVNLIGLACALTVLPLSGIVGCTGVHACWFNAKTITLCPRLEWASIILPAPLDLVAVALSWLRFRESRT
jgi:hypothetical protein